MFIRVVQKFRSLQMAAGNQDRARIHLWTSDPKVSSQKIKPGIVREIFWSFPIVRFLDFNAPEFLLINYLETLGKGYNSSC